MDTLDVLVEVVNHASLRANFGEAVARCVLDGICAGVSGIAGRDVQVVLEDVGCIRLRFPGAVRDVLASSAAYQLEFLDTLRRDLCNWVAGSSRVVMLAALRVGWADAPDASSDRAGGPVLAAADVVGGDDRYVALAVLEALRCNRVVFAYQPICQIDDQARVIYYESLVRIKRRETGELMFPDAFIPSLERLSLTRSLDRYAIKHAINLLSERPGLVLGVNISAQTAVDDVWWTSALDNLASRPEVAGRLVVEITETAPLQCGGGGQFVRRLQACGCRVAIDDFGSGYGMQTGLEIGTPDIVKLDRGLLHEGGSDWRERLARAAAIANELAPVVVAEGVETESALQSCRDAGVHAVQGYYLGRPVVWR
jgi:EAL domain-containing protein (putative c-di-GMP-specific phosphodiesterase class I)